MSPLAMNQTIPRQVQAFNALRLANRSCNLCGDDLPARSSLQRMYCGTRCLIKAYRQNQRDESHDQRLARSRAAAAAKRVAMPDAARDGHMRRYGLSAVAYDALAVTQGHLCAACGHPEKVTRHGTPVRLSVDHDHVTGVVRGLLCGQCNFALGLCDDDPGRLELLAAYLRRAR